MTVAAGAAGPEIASAQGPATGRRQRHSYLQNIILHTSSPYYTTCGVCRADVALLNAAPIALLRQSGHDSIFCIHTKLKGELPEMDVKCNDLTDQRDRLRELVSETDDCCNHYEQALLQI
ncbi:hypothetical protein EVAR_62848_1 [Eumeta japonica]|uniref:Uncharacterized protein n=1 Tax=Eumeta variegata TaxID=151549 RepID=A0A4C1ZIP1_EUMVA|nr:hypothetical protein EVAR_62848_1 [Eumeta japonica]